MTDQKKPPIVSPYPEDAPLDDVLDEGPPPPPPWDPKQHPIAAEIITYTPGQRLIYLQGGGYGSASLILLASLLFGWLAGTLFHQLTFWIISTVSIAGLYVMITWKAGAYHAIHWRFDLDDRRLSIATSEDKFVYDLNGVTGIGLEVVAREHWWSSSLGGRWKRYRYESYNAQVLLQGILEDSDLVIAETGFLQRDKWFVHHIALCFAHTLSEAIDAPLLEDSLKAPADDGG